MITTLHIKNIGIIDDVSINLNEGLNILTGETGAGKTLLIDSLGIISGERFSKEMIRTGETHSYVEACLYLPERTEAVDGNIIVSREIYANGRNMCKINGRMVTVNELKDFMQSMVDIHGQHDNQYLLNVASHIEYLDNFAQREIKETMEEYKLLYAEYLRIQQELKENYGDDKEKQRKLDLFQYQFEEIEKANLVIGEDEELEKKREIILNAEKINENLNVADMAVSEQTMDAMNTAIRALEKIESFNSDYAKQLQGLKSAYYDVQEIARDISSLREEVYFDEEERRELEMRLDTIYSLKRKYGNTIEEILAYQEEIATEIEHIENLEEHIQKLKGNLEDTKHKMHELSMTMHHIREAKAKELEKQINKELQELEMKNAQVTIVVELNEEEKYNAKGLDIVEMLIRTNV